MATLRTQTNSSACLMTAQVSLVVAPLAPLRPLTPPGAPDRRGVRRKILIQVCFLRSTLADDVHRDVVCLFVAEHGCIEGGSDRHVVHCIGGGRQKAAHPRAIVEAVRPPQW